MLRPLLLGILCLPWLGVASSEPQHFSVVYEYKEGHALLTLNDFAFPSVKRGIAVGFTEDKDKAKGVVLVSSDAGEHWNEVPFKEIPLSIFFLDDSQGWMVTDKGLWRTRESGRSWEKLKKPPKEIQRVTFLDADHGWAFGSNKVLLETANGGMDWTPVAAANLAQGTPEWVTFGTLNFADKQFGLITGWSTPPRRIRNDVPEWADPAEAPLHRELPSLSVFLETRDGGRSWKPSAASMFGRMTRTALNEGPWALGLVEFTDDFEWPSEVYRINLRSGASERAFREADRVITDVRLAGDGAGYLAGYEPVGRVRRSPIPGPVKVLVSRDLQTWDEIPVSYKAEAHRVFLAAPGPADIWIATDTGMILKLR